MLTPFLTVPNEILYDIARRLPLCCTISLLQTCHAMAQPLDAFLLASHKNAMLLSAASHNHLTLLKRALAAGADIEYSTSNGGTSLNCPSANGHAAELEYREFGDDCTPLLHAARMGYEDCVHLLLDAGANPNATYRGETLLVCLINANLTTIATRFINQMDATALHDAIEHRHYTIAKLMFDSGITKTVPAPLHLAVSRGLKYVKLCIDHGAEINAPQEPDYDTGHPGGYTALGIAAHRGKMDIMKYLLEEGADPNAGSGYEYPVFGAVTRSHPNALRMLLQHGVDVRYYRNQTNLLSSACERGSREIVELLLDAFEALGDDWSWVGDAELLYAAVRDENSGVVQLLLQRGAEVNKLSQTGRHGTALLCAVKNGSRELVEILLEGGADPCIVVKGKTALIWAKESDGSVVERGLMMAVLLRGGADITELSKRWTKKIHAFIRQLEQEISGE